MAIIKCKMCGGDLNLIEGQSVAECEYCGSRQTVPSADNEKKLTLFARANRLRAACEFDKAAGIYESIVADFPEEAEAYWGLVLCKYGIEYVDDPATGKKIPTCHRSSFDSIMEDGDFEQALENADVMARKVYREEAKQIEEIRKGIIAVSANEAPYDIFICYKETDANGDRTLDSVLAQDIYDALTDKGYRVFFARITLEDKLGQAYEPYIFAALNSAKIMLAVGTDYEYFNAVWVKNEWSRYLKLMVNDKDKHLIPCFKGIDAYDMPKEFARLQAQDLGKVGAMQDLLRGIEKILPKQKNTTIIQEKVVVGGSGNNKIASLLDRGNMALEDGDWAKADSFFEDVLNNDSKNAQAYLGKTLATEKCRTIDAFARKRKDASQNVKGQTLHLEPNHAHVDEMVQKYSLPGYVEQSKIRKLYDFDLSYHSDVAERKQQYRSEELYWTNHKQLSRAEKFAVGAVAENLQREKKALFAVLSERVKKAEEAESKAKAELQARYDAHISKADEQARGLYEAGLEDRQEYYQALLQIAKTSADVEALTEAAEKYEQLGNYKDSRNLAEHCRKRAVEEQAKLDTEAERQRKIAAQQAVARKKKNTTIGIIAAAAAAVVIAAVLIVTQVIIPSNNYKAAEELLANGQYEEAIAAFEALGEYENSPERVLETTYLMAKKMADSGDYEGAIEIFLSLENYGDSSEEAKKVTYAMAEQWMNTGDYASAAVVFDTIDDYMDAQDKAHYARVQLLYQADVGDIVYFGRYEQDNDLENGSETIEWIVLEKEEDSIFVISKAVLDAQKFYDHEKSTTWEKSDIRGWLREDFMETAFSIDEKKAIELSVLSTADSTGGVDGGPDTQDYVFLLSIEEVNQYFSDDASRIAYPTPYAYAQKCPTYGDEDAAPWLLRSPGYSDNWNGNLRNYASGVKYDGEVSEMWTNSYSLCGVRPAMHINLDDLQ